MSFANLEQMITVTKMSPFAFWYLGVKEQQSRASTSKKEGLGLIWGKHLFCGALTETIEQLSEMEVNSYIFLLCFSESSFRESEPFSHYYVFIHSKVYVIKNVHMMNWVLAVSITLETRASLLLEILKQRMKFNESTGTFANEK